MYLLIGQLVHTSFAERGFRTLASMQVPVEIQQAFIQRVVYHYWDSYNPPMAGYRAVYLHQVTLEQTLFGWLYNDGADDLGRGGVPYFVCYYLAEPLFDFLLANIFTCLEQGPVALIDRHSLTTYLDTIAIPNFWSYQPAHPGVATPQEVRQHSYAALRQGKLLDLFIPVSSEQEMVIDLQGQTYEQQIADLSIYTHYVIEGLSLGTTDSSEENAATIQTGSVQTYQSYKQRLQLYKQVLGKKNQPRYPLRVNTGSWLFKNKNMEPIKTWLTLQTVVANKYDTTYRFTRKVISQTIAGLPNLSQTLNQSTDYHAMPAYKNSQLLLKIAIAATVLALASAIYGLHYTTSESYPNNPNSISWTSNSVVYKTLAEVPNVPEGMFSYGGSTSFAPLRSKAIVSVIAQAHPKFQLLYTELTGNKHGSKVGIEMLLAGKLSFAQSSRLIEDIELKQAEKLGFTLVLIPIATDGVTFYVNPQVAIPGLSLSQIRDIFTGKISNWKALGGPDLPIIPFIPFSRNPEFSGTEEFVKEKVLVGEEFGSNVQKLETTTDSIRLVAKTPGGIGYATASEVINQKTVAPVSLATTNPLPSSIKDKQAFVPPFEKANKNNVINKAAFINGSYPLTRSLFVIIKRDGGVDEQAGIAYANLLSSEQGQRLVERAGFAPSR